MKVCAACHEDLPKESYSKKQWKLDQYQRRCKVCVTNNQEVQLQQPPSNNDTNTTNTNGIVKLLDTMYLEDVGKISDEELFKQPPPEEDCPICFLLLPTFNSGRKYYTCCGKRICGTPAALTDKENKERLRKRVEANDPIAIFIRGNYHKDRRGGFSQDMDKALELWHRAGELGYAKAYVSIGVAYNRGEGVEADKKKSQHYYELAAIQGDVDARYNLGNDELHVGLKEMNTGNIDRAIKHFLIAVGSGIDKSLEKIKGLYKYELTTKDDYMKALQSYQGHLSEIMSSQRDEAAAFSEEYRYY